MTNITIHHTLYVRVIIAYHNEGVRLEERFDGTLDDCAERAVLNVKHYGFLFANIRDEDSGTVYAVVDNE